MVPTTLYVTARLAWLGSGPNPAVHKRAHIRRGSTHRALSMSKPLGTAALTRAAAKTKRRSPASSPKLPSSLPAPPPLPHPPPPPPAPLILKGKVALSVGEPFTIPFEIPYGGCAVRYSYEATPASGNSIEFAITSQADPDVPLPPHRPWSAPTMAR